ncbi:MAG: hypothetical protein EZS28_036057 [Streblomastix strix]|uniref:Uncharacterized protein n=1 Tax=Streblomastix strix TaxID=222440 RepID=A0A5J4UFS2_9EUKA|nr:MAG: hypothetical protein EZS28_036057 [Streblomastix strix]
MSRQQEQQQLRHSNRNSKDVRRMGGVRRMRIAENEARKMKIKEENLEISLNNQEVAVPNRLLEKIGLMEQDRRGESGEERSWSGLERQGSEIIVRQISKDNRGEESKETIGYILTRTDEGSQRQHCRTGVGERIIEQEPIVYKTQDQLQIQQDYELEISEQSSKWNPHQDGRCERDNGFVGDGRFSDNAGSRRSIPSYKGNTRTEQVFQFSFQGQGLPMQRTAIRVHSEPSYILSNPESSSQCNQRAAPNQDRDVYGRPIINWQELTKTRVRYNQDSGYTQGSRLEDRGKQMQDGSEDDIRVLMMALGYSKLNSYNAIYKKEGD